MSKATNEIARMLRSALTTELELGDDEVVLSRKLRRPLSLSLENLNQSSVEPKMEAEMETTVAEARYDSLDDHRAAICECQKCSLEATRNKFVYGVGNPKADLMLIGEAPGANEDLQGEPFVGRGGQLLDKILAAIDLSRDQVYIANILKCRPPQNRDPAPDEMKLCFPYLKEQIAIINPKLICALGRIAAQAVLDTNSPLGKLRGEFHTYQGRPLLVTYHPAALLRFAKYKRDTWEDMKLLKKKLDELTR